MSFFLPAALGGSPRRATLAKKLSPKRKTMRMRLRLPVSPKRNNEMSPTKPTKPDRLHVLVMGPSFGSGSATKHYRAFCSDTQGLSYDFGVSENEIVNVALHKHDSDEYFTSMRNAAMQAKTFELAIVFADSPQKALATLKTIRENTKLRTPQLCVMLVIDRIAIDSANIASYSKHKHASSFLSNFNYYMPVTKDNEDLILPATEEIVLQHAKSANVYRHRVT